MNLVLSLVALALGPLLYSAFSKRESVRGALDGLLFVTIAGIVVVHILPDVFDIAGFTALAFLAAGVAFAFFVERQPSSAGADRYTWIVFLGALGLMIHAALDGIALIPADHLHELGTGATDGHTHQEGLSGVLSNHLALGVILHRIPVGMAIWWTLRPRLGSTVAYGALAIIAIATSVAYLLGESVIALMQATSFACFQAFVAGTLLHVIVFSSVGRNLRDREKSHDDTVFAERLGIVAGLFLLFLIPHAH
ncbi:MAG: hypothetical protein QNJ11_11125 [Woeseiaceae bacterium]|nr:hypothetical protein [Woeseiaceae bacterium]